MPVGRFMIWGILEILKTNYHININVITVVYILHRTDCFGSEIFRICLQSLLLNQESDQYLELVDMIGKRKK